VSAPAAELEAVRMPMILALLRINCR